MRSLAQERTLPSAGLQAALVVGCGLVLAWLISSGPMPLVIVAFLAVTFTIVFVQRPDLGLLSVLIIRAASDVLVVSSPTSAAMAGRFASSPNVGLLLLVILVGGLFVLTHRIPFLRLPGALPLVFLLLTGGVGMLHAPSIAMGLDRWLAVLSALIIYALAAALFRKPQQVQNVISILAVAFIAPALVGLNQVISRHGCKVDEDILRICGTFVHPNPFAFFLVIIISVFLCQAVAQRGGRRLLAVLIVGTSAILLVWTQTRSAWVGALIVLLTIGAARNRRVLLLALLLVGGAVVLMPSIGSRVADPTGGSFADRVDIWQSAYGEWVNTTFNDMSSFATVLNRIAGTGPGSVGFLTAPSRGGENYAAHDDYLLVLFEYGVFGLVAFLVMFVSLMASAARTWRQSRNTMMEPVALSFFALTLAYPVISLTDNLFGQTQNQLYFWTLAGLTAAIGRMSARTEQNASAGQAILRGAEMMNPSPSGM